jgi:hypothetical protein
MPLKIDKFHYRSTQAMLFMRLTSSCPFEAGRKRSFSGAPRSIEIRVSQSIYACRPELRLKRITRTQTSSHDAPGGLVMPTLDA